MAVPDDPRPRTSSTLRALTAVLSEPAPASAGALVLADQSPESAGQLIDLARRHGVEAWLAGYAPLAEPAWAELAAQRPRFLAAQARTLAAVRELAVLLDGSAISWLVLKGPALAHSVYPRPDLRHYVDLDLLVPPSEYREVLRLVESAGYLLIDRNWPLLERQRPGELRLRSPRGVLLDLHWSIFNDAARRGQFDAPTERLLAARRVLEPAGFPALSATDQLVHAGLHAALSGANRLGWLLDLHLAATAIGTEPADWSEINELAQRVGAGPALAVVLRRCRQLLGTRLPAGLLAELAGGPAWVLVAGGLDRLSPLQADPDRPSLARSVARSARPSGAASGKELARHAWLWLRAGAARRYVRPAWLEADNPESALRDVADPAARDRYLSAVQQDR